MSEDVGKQGFIKQDAFWRRARKNASFRRWGCILGILGISLVLTKAVKVPSKADASSRAVVGSAGTALLGQTITDGQEKVAELY